MSFGFVVAGNKQDVSDDISAVKQYGSEVNPQLGAVKQFVLEQVNTGPDDKLYIIRANGHQDSGVLNFSITFETHYKVR